MSHIGLSWRRWLGRGAITPLATRDAYAQWASSYPAQPHNPLMVAEQQALVSLLSGIQATRALDVGTGTGRCQPLLATTGASVVGVDLSWAMLSRGRPRSALVCADACRLPFGSDRFDLVGASLMVGDIADLGNWSAEMSRVLQPGGHLIYSDFHPSWASLGWRRTFRAAGGRQFELSYFPHALDEHRSRLDAAGLTVKAIREPEIEGRTSPVAVVFHAVKR